MSLDAESRVPLYFQLKQILLAAIEDGRWKAGELLPTEHQLMAQYRVSRTTVRQAMQELELEGKITRYRGRGTFVARRKATHTPTFNATLTDHLLEQGIQAGWKLLSAELVDATPEQKALFELMPSQSQVFCLRRLRMEGEVPIGYHLAYTPPHFAAFIDQSAFTIGGSLRYLQAHPDMPDCIADRILEAVPASAEEAALLGVEKGAPMLLIRRMIRNPDNLLIELFKGIYRGDRFEYRINSMPAVSRINA